MDRLTIVFWTIVSLLLGSSVFYGVNAETQRRGVQQAKETLENGDVVNLVKAIDGNTILVNKPGQGNTTLRILGIQAFEAKIERDATAAYGQAAIDGLLRILGNKPIHILLHSISRDKSGKTLATLFVDDQDVGLALVSEGHALVYSVFPFPLLPMYQREQASARAAGKGLWANAEVTSRADVLIREWRKRSP